MPPPPPLGPRNPSPPPRPASGGREGWRRTSDDVPCTFSRVAKRIIFLATGRCRRRELKEGARQKRRRGRAGRAASPRARGRASTPPQGQNRKRSEARKRKSGRPRHARQGCLHGIPPMTLVWPVSGPGGAPGPKKRPPRPVTPSPLPIILITQRRRERRDGPNLPKNLGKTRFFRHAVCHAVGPGNGLIT